MTQRQALKQAMYRSTDSYLDEHRELITPITKLPAYQGQLKIYIGDLDRASGVKSKVTKGATVTKNMVQEELCRKTFDMASFLLAYADDTKNETLKAAVNFPFSELLSLRMEPLLTKAQTIYTLCQKHQEALAPYLIEANQIEDFASLIDHYTHAMPGARVAASTKTTFVEELRKLVKQSDTLLKDKMDRLVFSMATKHPDFVAGYKMARKIVNSGGGKASKQDPTLPLIDAPKAS